MNSMSHRIKLQQHSSGQVLAGSVNRPRQNGS